MIVCDGFTGNVALKLSEGLVEMVEDLLGEELQSTFSSQVGYLLSRRAFRRFRKRVDYSEYGGAPLLGVAGLCIVGHGRSSVKAVRNAVAMASRMAEQPDAGASRAGDGGSGGEPNRDRFRVSRTGLAGGRHGQGARRAVSRMCAQTFAEADAALGEPLSDLIFNGPADALTLTENTQPAILTMSIAACRLLDVARRSSPRSWRATASASIRRTSPPARWRLPTPCAWCATAAATCRKRCRSAPARWRRSSGSIEAGVAQACEEAAQGEVVSPANLNGAGQIVIAGTAAAVARASERAKALGAKRAIPLHGERAVSLRADEAGRRCA